MSGPRIRRLHSDGVTVFYRRIEYFGGLQRTVFDGKTRVVIVTGTRNQGIRMRIAHVRIRGGQRPHRGPNRRILVHRRRKKRDIGRGTVAIDKNSELNRSVDEAQSGVGTKIADVV